jgi:hypothetical protein
MTYEGPSKEKLELLAIYPEYQCFQNTIDDAFKQIDVNERLVEFMQNGPYNPFRGFLTLSEEKIYKN